MMIAPMLSTNFRLDYDYGITDWLVSQKIDGIRCLVQTGTCSKYGTTERVFARSGKRIPNHYIRKILSLLPDGFDGEIAPAYYSFQDATSMAMTQAGQPAFRYYIFNYFGNGEGSYLIKPLSQRLADAEAILTEAMQEHPELAKHVCLLEYKKVSLQEALLLCDQLCEQGAEGLILTHADAPYLTRRCLPSQPHSLKLKPFADAEAIIVGFEPAIATGKYAIEQGIAGQEKQELGALILASKHFLEPFKCGTGFTKEQREQIWQNKAEYANKCIKFKYIEAGTKKADGLHQLRPRSPVFLGFRADEDL